VSAGWRLDACAATIILWGTQHLSNRTSLFVDLVHRAILLLLANSSQLKLTFC
jgi:hypothetical protein